MKKKLLLHPAFPGHGSWVIEEPHLRADAGVPVFRCCVCPDYRSRGRKRMFNLSRHASSRGHRTNVEAKLRVRLPIPNRQQCPSLPGTQFCNSTGYSVTGANGCCSTCHCVNVWLQLIMMLLRLIQTFISFPVSKKLILIGCLMPTLNSVNILKARLSTCLGGQTETTFVSRRAV